MTPGVTIVEFDARNIEFVVTSRQHAHFIEMLQGPCPSIHLDDFKELRIETLIGGLLKTLHVPGLYPGSSLITILFTGPCNVVIPVSHAEFPDLWRNLQKSETPGWTPGGDRIEVRRSGKPLFEVHTRPRPLDEAA